MRSKWGLFFAVALAIGPLAVFEGCSASGGDDGADNNGGPTGEDGGDVIDGNVVFPDGGENEDAIADAAPPVVVDGCVLTPPSDTCGIFPNCGCGATTCDYLLDGGATLPSACTPSVGTAIAGATCAATTDCAQGLTCLYDKCRPYCDIPGTPCGGALSDCRARAGYDVCSIQCTLSDPASCGAANNLGCVAIGAGSIATSECEPVGSGGANAVCTTTAADCAPGYNCVMTTSKQCKQNCEYPNGACPSGSCNQISPSLVVDGTEYGFCE